MTQKRAIRSFVRREGRITVGQQRALTELLPRYGIEPGTAPLDFAALFGRSVPVIMEIGFGDGGALLEMAAHRPDCDFVGVEVFRPGVGRLLLNLSEHGLTNVRVVVRDAVEVLRDQVTDDALAKLLIFFPDPWPKKRHHKRRLVNPEFARLAARRIHPGGYLHVATDWRDYALHIVEVMREVDTLRNTGDEHGFAQRPGYRPQTKYERRGGRLGHDVWDLVFQRV